MKNTISSFTLKTGLVVLFCLSSQPLYAAWWTCEVGFEKKGFFGWSITGNDIIVEVEADRESRAKEAAVYNSGNFFVTGFVGKNAYVCGPDWEKDGDGNACKYRFIHVADCRRQ